MTDSEALVMLEAKLKCMNREDDIEYERACHPENDECDSCELCYAQGNRGEQKNAIEMAINALENHMKENADGCAGCAFEDVEEWEMPCRKCKRNNKDYWRRKRSE